MGDLIEHLLTLIKDGRINNMLRENQEDLAKDALEEYRKKCEEIDFLDCLRAAGVDNWNGYSDAQEMLEGDD